jgi:hypothetical protein
MKKWLLAIGLLTVLATSFAIGRHQTMNNEPWLANVNGLPISIKRGSVDALNEALNSNPSRLSVDVYYLPGFEDGVSHDPLVSVYYLTRRTIGNYVHVESLNKEQTKAVKKLTEKSIPPTYKLDLEGREPDVDAILYFQITNRVTDRVVFSFSFGLYSSNIWVNGAIIERDADYIGIVEPFLPISEAIGWTKAVDGIWRTKKDDN